MTGISSSYEPPDSPEVEVRTDIKEDPIPFGLGQFQYFSGFGKNAPLAPLVQRPTALPTVFDFPTHFCHSAPMETHAFGFRLRATPRTAKSDFLSVTAHDLSRR
jgi:hypothetical protein